MRNFARATVGALMLGGIAMPAWAQSDAGAAEPASAQDSADDNAKDVIVVKGIGHDDFADRMIQSSDNPKVPLIEANANVPVNPEDLQVTQVDARDAA